MTLRWGVEVPLVEVDAEDEGFSEGVAVPERAGVRLVGRRLERMPVLVRSRSSEVEGASVSSCDA